MQNLKRFSLIFLILIFIPSCFQKNNIKYINNNSFYGYDSKSYTYDFILSIDKINLNVRGNYETKLSEGLEVHEVSKKENTPFIISGHSGVGDNVFFNELHLLREGDEIILQKEDKIYTYIVESVLYFTKGQKISINNNSDYLYLITCDLYDMQKQLIISSKLVKNAKK